MILYVLLFSSLSSFSQSRKSYPNHFGFQFRPLIPIGVVGDRPFDINKEGFSTTVTSRFGYSYGGVVRVGITNLMAIETGINYIKRSYRLDFSVPDSNLVGQNNVGMVNYDIPLNLLVYIKLSNTWFMNASMGGSLNFYPSNVRTLINPYSQHLFIFEGRRFAFFSNDINANIGFEYRSENAGIFYIGMSGKLPIQPIYWIASEYRFDTQRTVGFDQIDGATVSLDFKYFIPQTQKRGVQFKPGPIEQ